MNAVASLFLLPLSPILSVVAAGCLVLVLESIWTHSMRTMKRAVGLLGPIVAIGFVVSLWQQWPIEFTATSLADAAPWLRGFGHHFHLDQTALVLIGGITVFTFFSLLFTAYYSPDEEADTEITSLILFIASGMMLLVTADSMLMVFLALELLSLPTYVLVGIKRKDRYSTEAALKYFLFGSFATVFLVLGIALLYAQFGTMHIPKLAQALTAQPLSQPNGPILVYGGLTLILVSVFFKIGIAPFHMWVPDAYEGAPSPITGFMGSGIKLAGFGLVMRVLWGLFLPLADQWIPVVNTLAVATMFIGNLAAVLQDNLKRMFAYSSVAHAGYLLLSIGALPRLGTHSSALLYYLLVYGLMFLGMFACIAIIEAKAKETQLQNLAGLGFKSPCLAACLAIFTLSAAGIPPTAGFLAKYFIFMEVVRAGQTPYLILAVISSLIAVYYYLRVFVYLYMKDDKSVTAIHAPRPVLIAVSVLAIAMVFFAVAPGLLGLGLFYR